MALGFSVSTNRTARWPIWGDDISSPLVGPSGRRPFRIDESYCQVADLGRRHSEPFSGALWPSVFPDRRIVLPGGRSGATTFRALNRASLALGFSGSTNRTLKWPIWGDDTSSPLVSIFDFRFFWIGESRYQMADLRRRHSSLLVRLLGPRFFRIDESHCQMAGSG